MNHASQIDWSWYQFQQLSNIELYAVLKLRQEVFIIEQKCIYPDLDGLDLKALHLLGFDDKKLMAYLRLIPVTFHKSAHITFGRIISSKAKRGLGIGKALMQQAMQYSAEHFPAQNIQLSAQYHLVDFYHNFGFKNISEPYDDDGIMHVDMLYEQNHGK